MNHPPAGGAPFFDWRLDRWKIGLALLLLLGLVLFPPTGGTTPDPQGASPIARPGQRPVVGATNQLGAAGDPEVIVQPPAEEAAQAGAEMASDPAAVDADPLGVGRLSVQIFTGDARPIANSTPLFYGQAEANALLEIALNRRRYAVAADRNGYWQFSPSMSLPVGMTWVQVRQVSAEGTPLSATVSRMALVAPGAEAVAAPEVLTPLSFGAPLADSTPLFTGTGPAWKGLHFYGLAEGESTPQRVGEVVVDGLGEWSWRWTPGLAPGTRTVWAVVIDPSGRELSRSWPVRFSVAQDATPSVLVEKPISGGNSTR